MNWCRPAKTIPFCRRIEAHCGGVAGLPASATGEQLLGLAELFEQRWNPFGEPTSALFCSEHCRDRGGVFEGCGQFSDIELWLRLIVGVKVGFVPHTVARFTVHAEQTTYQNLVSGSELNDLEAFLSRLPKLDCWPLLHPSIRERAQAELKATRRTLALPFFDLRRKLFLRRL